MLSVIFKSKYTSAVNYGRLMLQEVDTQCVILIQIRVNMWINYIPSIIISKSTRKRKQGSSIVATIDKTLSLASNHECGDLQNMNVSWNYQIWLSVSKVNLMLWYYFIVAFKLTLILAVWYINIILHNINNVLPSHL